MAPATSLHHGLARWYVPLTRQQPAPAPELESRRARPFEAFNQRDTQNVAPSQYSVATARRERPRTTSDARLLGLVVEPVVLTSGETALRFRLRNVQETRAIWISTEFRLPLEISNEASKPMLDDCRWKGGPSPGPVYIQLEPLQEISVVRSLMCYHLVPGRYTVVARHPDQRGNAPLPPSNASCEVEQRWG